MISNDLELLKKYVTRGSDVAFEALVSRHVNLVYSAARRQVGDAHLAQEITQAVFMLLARKAASLGPGTILPSWLYRTTRFVAADALRSERRRRQREQEAYMQTALERAATDDIWEQLLPLLDEAMARLRQSDRDALVLRYFENRSLQEVGEALGLEERAAQKRVARSLEKLRSLFLKRGVALSAAAIAGAVSAHSVQAAPASLTVSALAVAKGTAAPASILVLAQSGSRWMAWAKAKMALLGGATAVAILLISVGIVYLTADRSIEVTAFNSFGPEKAVDLSMGWGLTGEDTNSARKLKFRGQAEWFEPSASGKLSGIELAIHSLSPGRLNISVARDAAGLPGPILERFSRVPAPPAYTKVVTSKILSERGTPSNVMPPLEPQPPGLFLRSEAKPYLEAGARYWICVEPADPSTEASWSNTSLNITNSFAYARSPWTWDIIEAAQMAPNASKAFTFKRGHRNGAFSVTVKKAPEKG